MPWDLTPEQQRLLNLSQRQLVQPKPDSTKPEDRKVGGHHVGDLLMLAAMDDLARQGNVVAREVADRLRAHMGISSPLYSFGGQPGGSEAPS